MDEGWRHAACPPWAGQALSYDTVRLAAEVHTYNDREQSIFSSHFGHGEPVIRDLSFVGTLSSRIPPSSSSRQHILYVYLSSALPLRYLAVRVILSFSNPSLPGQHRSRMRTWRPRSGVRTWPPGPKLPPPQPWRRSIASTMGS